jgi:hypothetical protein
MSQPRILTPQEVADIKANGWALIVDEELSELCDSHERLRAELEERAQPMEYCPTCEQAVETVRSVAHPHLRQCPKCWSYTERQPAPVK